ncbi:MAG: hypothetical protein IIC60_08785 [Proteobacteria bacterium]|nr:hypothetical protein [Pseudomonadota bacterium]
MSEGNEDSEKVAFGSSEWLARARQILEELVAEHGEAGTSFSVCEVFTDAPSGLIGPEDNVAAWHFSIVDNSVTVGEGESENADLQVKIDYHEVLPRARLVYTPEILEEMQRNPPDPGFDRSKIPSYLVELHNRLAVITA